MNSKLKRILGAICALTVAFSCAAMAGCDNTENPDKDPDKAQTDVTNPDDKKPNDGTDDKKPDDGTDDKKPNDGTDNWPPFEIPDGTVADRTYALGQSYIKSHAEGTAVTYVMEAENTVLKGKKGVGYSGELSNKDLVINPSAEYNTGASNNQMVNYLYRKGVSLQFFIVSDREVDDAILQIRLSAEYMDMIIGPQESVGASNDYVIRVDQPTVEDLADAEHDGAWEHWDEYFLNYYDKNPDKRDPGAAAPYYVTDWECTFEKDGTTYNGIRMDASEYGAVLMPCQNFTITSHLKLYKGITCISFITNSSAKPLNSNTGAPLGTMDAYAPVFDCIGITTTAQIGMYKPVANNNKTANAYFIDDTHKVFN